MPRNRSIRRSNIVEKIDNVQLKSKREESTKKHLKNLSFKDTDAEYGIVDEDELRRKMVEIVEDYKMK